CDKPLLSLMIDSQYVQREVPHTIIPKQLLRSLVYVFLKMLAHLRDILQCQSFLQTNGFRLRIHAVHPSSRHSPPEWLSLRPAATGHKFFPKELDTRTTGFPMVPPHLPSPIAKLEKNRSSHRLKSSAMLALYLQVEVGVVYPHIPGLFLAIPQAGQTLHSPTLCACDMPSPILNHHQGQSH